MSKESFTSHGRNPEDVTSGNKTQNDIETKEDFEPKTGYDDAFFINKENESITWIYFNPDSVSGGQYVINMLSFDEIRKATQDYESADGFFDYLGSIANQTLADVGTEWFEEAENAFRQTPDLTNCSTETMEKLTALTEERYKSIPQDKVIDESNYRLLSRLKSDFEDIKDKLFIRICGVGINEEDLSILANTKINNLAIAYNVLIDKLTDYPPIKSIKITNELLDKYGVSKEELHKAAIQNSEKIFPAKYYKTNDLIPFNILTNEIGYLGAAALFYPNQMKKIAASLGGNYFVLPSSIHEVLVLPDYGNLNYMELEQMVKVVNKTTVDRNDQLSNNVYYYDSKEKLFSLASEHEKRSKNIENKSVNSKKNVDNFLDRTNKFSKDNDVSKENISKNNEIEF